MVVLAVLLAVATMRGDVAEAEAGEDVDLVNVLGWAVTGAMLFAGCAWALGSRTLVRDVIVGAVLAVASWYFFWGLGVPLEPGILDGIL
jgi:putative tricarboxylic transport membrane protein